MKDLPFLPVNSDLRLLSRKQAGMKSREFIQRKIKIIEDKRLNKKYTEHIMEKVKLSFKHGTCRNNLYMEFMLCITATC